MNSEKFIDLVSKKFSGQLGVSDTELLNKLIADNEEYRLLYAKMKKYLQEKRSVETDRAALNTIWKTINTAGSGEFTGMFDYSGPVRHSLFQNSFFKIAAVLVFCIGAALLGYKLLSTDSNDNLNTANSGDGKIFRMLDDGTRIWLNKHSSITYNSGFGKNKREIVLDGEGYFDVVKNSKVPLFITAGNIDIEVKGTAFNVNAYKEENEIEVALVRGALEVSDRLNSAYKVSLKPNEKLIFSKIPSSGSQTNFKVLSLASSLVLKDIQWTADTLIFRKEKLKDLALRMEKKYDLKIVVKSEQLKEKRFSGTFTDESIQQALTALKRSYPLYYTISDRLVTISDKE